MEKRKRPQACKACRALKMRCEQDESQSQACLRCWRTGKECVPALSRRQRDKIAELEASIEDLTTALESAKLESYRRPDSTEEERASLPQHQRTNTLAIIDKHVTEELQQKALIHYMSTNVPLFPAFPVTVDVALVRQRSPVLLLSILAFPVSQAIHPDVQYQLIGECFHLFGTFLLGHGTGSLDIVQALLVAAYWYRHRRTGANVQQLIQIATNMACDIGIAGRAVHKVPGARHVQAPAPSSAEARRTWLACFVATSSMSAYLRRIDANVWNAYHEECLAYLESKADDACETDLLFCQVVRGERLCNSIIAELHLCDPYAPFWDATTGPNKKVYARLKERIETYAAQLPAALEESPLIKFWRWMALIYLNEPILHTGTNRHSFAGPGEPWTLNPTDFAHPEPIADHEESLYALQTGCICALEAFVRIDPRLIAGASTVCFLPKMKYAQTMLLKLYVAVVAPENTYGRIVHADELKIQAHFDHILPLANTIMEIDNTYLGNQIVAVSYALESWWQKYKAIVEAYAASSARAASDTMSPSSNGTLA